MPIPSIIPFSLVCLIACAAPKAAQGQDSLFNRNYVPVLEMDALIADTLVSRGQKTTEQPDSAIRSTPVTASAGTDSVSPATDSGAAAKVAAIPGRALLRGQVLAGDDGKPIADATVILQRASLRLSGRSDTEGLYRIGSIEPGSWRLSVLRKGYDTKQLPLEPFFAGEDRLLEIRLERRALKGQVIQAKSERKAGSSQDMLAKRQKSAAVMEGVSAEQIAKTTDSDAGAVARRITGTSLLGGKYVYVRGLGERYTNMTMNGLPIPSPEKDKRVVPQDLFPAGSLESFAIYKTFVPDLYADFAGGSVALVTKGIPEKSFFKISTSTGNHYYGRMDTSDFLASYRKEAPRNGHEVKTLPAGWQVGNARLTYSGGNTFWGFDDGTRSLPDGFPGLIPKGQSEQAAIDARAKGLPGYSPDQRAGFAEQLPNTYSIDTSRIRPPANLSISAGKVLTAGGGGKLGYLLHAGFKNKYDQNVIQRQVVSSAFAFVKDTAYNPTLKRNVVNNVRLYDSVPTDTGIRLDPVRILKPDITSQIQQGTYDAQLSGMLNLGYQNPDWSVWWKNFAINIGTDKALLTRSYQVQAGGGIVTQDKPYQERYLLEFSRRSLISSQIGGEAYIGRGLVDSMSWAAGLSAVTGETPDSRRYLYSQTALKADEPLQYANNDVWGTRIFEELDEKAVAGRADAYLAIPPEYSARDTFLVENRVFSRLALPTFTTGFAFNGRSREFRATRFSYDKDRNINSGKTLEEIRAPDLLEQDILSGASDFYTSPKDRDTYDASEIQAASYLAGGTSARLFRMPVGMDGGVRVEWYDFRLRAPYTGLDADLEDLETKVREWSAYPTAGLWAQPIQPLKLRLQYARTAVRPEIREIAPYAFSDYVTGRSVVGNPELTKTGITHYDVRADYFLPYQQTLSASLFYKDFTRPVETTINIDKQESYQNAQGAYVKGVEFEANLTPGRWLEGLGITAAWLYGLRVSGNIAFMQSSVRLFNDTNKNLQLTNYNRSLVGQSPILINASATHEAETGIFTFLNAVLFNLGGERVRYAGTSSVPDNMELSFPSLESLNRVTWWKRNEFSVRVKNWLAQGKELRVREFNDEIEYHSVSPAKFQEVFGNAPRYHTIERTQDGISVEINYSRQL